MISPLDGVILAILAIGSLRGLLRGLIRETFSIGALGGAVIGVRYGMTPAADWIVEVTGGEISEVAAPWMAGIVIGCCVIVAITFVGRFLRRGARAAGLGWFDRLGGGALGAAEGALVSALLLLGVIWVMGPGHPVLAESRSIEAFEEFQAAMQEPVEEQPDVAAGAPPLD